MLKSKKTRIERLNFFTTSFSGLISLKSKKTRIERTISIRKFQVKMKRVKIQENKD